MIDHFEDDIDNHFVHVIYEKICFYLLIMQLFLIIYQS